MEAAEADVKTIRGNSTIKELFGIIESAIEVAATKYPQEFSNRKSKVVELLSAQSSMINNETTPTNINNVEEPVQKKKPLLKLKMKGRIISKICDKQPMQTPVKICPPLVTHPEVIKKDEITNESLKLEASKRKLAERYMEAKNARKTIEVLELCDLPQKQDFSVGKKVPRRPKTFGRRL